MNDTLDLDEALQVALQTTMEVARMDAGGVLLLDPCGSELLLKAHIGGPPTLVHTSGSVHVDEGLMPRMLTSVFATNEWAGMTEKRRLALEESGTRSLLSIPLAGDGCLQGVMILVSHQWRTFDDAELDFYAIVGRHVGSALYRINLQTQELRTAILEERQAIARQMHDDIAQTLACLGLYVDVTRCSVLPVRSCALRVALATRAAFDDGGPADCAPAACASPDSAASTTNNIAALCGKGWLGDVIGRMRVSAIYTLCVDNNRLVSEFDTPLIVRMPRSASSNFSRLSVPNSATISHRPLVVCSARTSGTREAPSGFRRNDRLPH